MDNLPVSAADAIFAVVIIVSGGLALYRGFVTEVLAVVGWAGAAIATVSLFNPLRPLARDFIPSQIGADVATGIVIFLVTLLVISLLARIVASAVRGSQISIIDRGLGLAFGVLRGYVVLIIVFLLYEQVYPRGDQPEWIRDARAVPLLDFGGTFLLRLVPVLPLEEETGFNRAGFSSAVLTDPAPGPGGSPASLESPRGPIPSLTSPVPPAITARILEAPPAAVQVQGR